ncbi:MAG: hypothetical protein HY835_03370 [Anaerolineae bacterium]|nr:hypothetical protein [Anaerolineae bacterium]
MLKSHSELWLAMLACGLIGAAYGAGVWLTRTVPAAGGWVGHSIGVLGFVLMLLTETLYSLRKRSRSARWGSMANWLKAHIFTGIVGPFMVLLHSSWKFNGLAGVVTLLTGLIVISGFVGRYIYTRIPRTAEGMEDPGQVSQMQINTLVAARRMLSLWHTVHIPIGMALFTLAFVHIVGAFLFSTLLK